MLLGAYAHILHPPASSLLLKPTKPHDANSVTPLLSHFSVGTILRKKGGREGKKEEKEEGRKEKQLIILKADK